MPEERNGKYIWTSHSRQKMNYYRLSESRIRRVIRHPARAEEGILPGAIACMQPAGGKRYSEIWTMYVLIKSKVKNSKLKVKVITAWRYPGRAPEHSPVPPEILREIRNLL